MKRKIGLISIISMSFVALVSLVGVSTTIQKTNVIEMTQVKAADPTTAYKIVGSFCGWEYSKGIALTYESTNTFTAFYNFTTSHEFKITNGSTWRGFDSIAHGTDLCTGSGNSNIKVRTGQLYKVTFWSDTTDCKIEKAYTATYYKEDQSTVHNTQKYVSGEKLNPLFLEKEGYRLSTWCSNKALTTNVSKSTSVTTNLSLYPKYDAASDYKIFLKRQQITSGSLYIYLYRDALDGGLNKAWPGETLTAHTNDWYVINIDASKSYDTIILNNNSNQTENIPLVFENGFITIDSTKNDYGAYTASCTILSANNLKTYLMEANTTNQCLTKFQYAELMYNSLNSTEKNNFNSGSTYTAAKARYDAWNVAYYSTNQNNLSNILSPITNNQNSYVIIGIILITGAVLLIELKLLRKRKNNVNNNK